MRPKMTKRRPSPLIREETLTPPRKQRRLTKKQAAITAAVYSAMLPHLELIDPLMEFTRACSSIKINTQKSTLADERELKVRRGLKVRRVVQELRERFENPPAPRSPKVVYNEYDEAEVLGSDEEETEDEEDEEIKPAKPRRKYKLNIILSQPGEDFVEVYKGPFKPAEQSQRQKTRSESKQRLRMRERRRRGERERRSPRRDKRKWIDSVVLSRTRRSQRGQVE